MLIALSEPIGLVALIYFFFLVDKALIIAFKMGYSGIMFGEKEKGDKE